MAREQATRHRPRRPRQHELEFRSWGGARRGAGRKAVGSRSRVSHRARPSMSGREPVHVTVRLRTGLPNLRSDANRVATTRAIRAGRERLGFRLTQYSLQSNHIHLIAEAEDRRALSRGMQGLLVRVSKSLNRLWRRRGSVFADRFHARLLSTPREVRSALVYVLHNARRHGLRILGIDPCSSGPWFDGWKSRIPATFASPTALARTWLLLEGWRRHALIGLAERPTTRTRVGRIRTASASSRT